MAIYLVAVSFLIESYFQHLKSCNSTWDAVCVEWYMLSVI